MPRHDDINSRTNRPGTSRPDWAASFGPPFASFPIGWTVRYRRPARRSANPDADIAAPEAETGVVAGSVVPDGDLRWVPVRVADAAPDTEPQLVRHTDILSLRPPPPGGPARHQRRRPDQHP